MKEWFKNLEPRERHMVIAGAAVLLVLLVYVAAWEPLVKGVARLEEANAEQRALNQWMQAAALEAKRLQAGSGASASSGASMLSVVDQAARGAQLGAAVKQIQPEGENLVRVTMERAAFDDVMGWLGDLQRAHGIGVQELSVERLAEAGRVNVRVTFKRAGAA